MGKGQGTGRGSNSGGSGKRAWGAPRGTKPNPGSFAEITGLGGILDSITSSGDGIIIAQTSDGGAFAITLLSGDQRIKRYPSNQADLDTAFAELAEMYDG